ncbi:gag-pol polyprotein [Tanacetum coccineum]
MSRDVITVGSTMHIPLLYRGLPNEIYSLIDIYDTAQELWDILVRHMRGSKYGEQRYESCNFKCGNKKDNYELNYKFLNNLLPEWKQYGTLMRKTKNLMDINIDALYNILKQNQYDVNDVVGIKKKEVVVTSDQLALVAGKSKESKSREKVIVDSDSEESDDEDIKDLKKITTLLAKSFYQTVGVQPKSSDRVMVFPSLKLGTLVLKTVSKPLASRLKQQAALHPKFRTSIIGLAQGFWKHGTSVDRRIQIGM